MSCSPISRICYHASVTSPTFTCFIKVSILWGKFVASFAVGFTRVLSSKSVTPKYILLISYDLKMIRIDALSILAEMVYHISFRYFAKLSLVDIPMKGCFLAVHVHITIAISNSTFRN